MDLHRVERDTKIRTKYLAALEEGEFADLPGDVYTRGFLRNYATYLGLDPDEIEDEWRQEGGEIQQVKPILSGPQPLTLRRKVVFQRSHVAIAVVAVIVLVVASYFGFQLTRYLSYPTVGVVGAGRSPVTVPGGTTSYVLKGTATANTTVLISWNGQDPKVVVADESGHWEYQAVLQPGRNQFDVTAKNLDTNHASDATRLIIVVLAPTPTPLVPQVAFISPNEGALLTDVNVTVAGTSMLVSSVTLTPVYLGVPLGPNATVPPPTPTAKATPIPSATAAGSSGASAGPTPTGLGQSASMKTDAAGAFKFIVKLRPGRWQLTLVGLSPKGVPTKAVSRTVNLMYTGINVFIQIKGGDGTLYAIRDGVVDYKFNPVSDGFSTTVIGQDYVCVSSLNDPQFVYITYNGKSYGVITQYGGHVMIDATGPRAAGACPTG